MSEEQPQLTFEFCKKKERNNYFLGAWYREGRSGWYCCPFRFFEQVHVLHIDRLYSRSNRWKVWLGEKCPVNTDTNTFEAANLEEAKSIALSMFKEKINEEINTAISTLSIT